MTWTCLYVCDIHRHIHTTYSPCQWDEVRFRPSSSSSPGQYECVSVCVCLDVCMFNRYFRETLSFSPRKLPAYPTDRACTNSNSSSMDLEGEGAGGRRREITQNQKGQALLHTCECVCFSNGIDGFVLTGSPLSLSPSSSHVKPGGVDMPLSLSLPRACDLMMKGRTAREHHSHTRTHRQAHGE